MSDPAQQATYFAIQLLANMGVDVAGSLLIGENQDKTPQELYEFTRDPALHHRLAMQPGRSLTPPPLPPLAQAPQLTLGADAIRQLTGYNQTSAKVEYSKRIKQLTLETAFGKAVEKSHHNKLQIGDKPMKFYRCAEAVVEVIRRIQANDEHAVSVTDMLFEPLENNSHVFSTATINCLQGVFQLLVGDSILAAVDAPPLETLSMMRDHSRMDNWVVRMEMYTDLVDATQDAPNFAAAWTKVQRFGSALKFTTYDLSLARAVADSPAKVKEELIERARLGEAADFKVLHNVRSTLANNRTTMRRSLNIAEPVTFSSATASYVGNSTAPSSGGSSVLDLGECSVGICRYSHGAKPCPMENQGCRQCWKKFGRDENTGIIHHSYGRCPNLPPNQNHAPEFLECDHGSYKRLAIGSIHGKGDGRQETPLTKLHRKHIRNKKGRSKRQGQKAQTTTVCTKNKRLPPPAIAEPSFLVSSTESSSASMEGSTDTTSNSTLAFSPPLSCSTPDTQTSDSTPATSPLLSCSTLDKQTSDSTPASSPTLSCSTPDKQTSDSSLAASPSLSCIKQNKEGEEGITQPTHVNPLDIVILENDTDNEEVYSEKETLREIENLTDSSKTEQDSRTCTANLLNDTRRQTPESQENTKARANYDDAEKANSKAGCNCDIPHMDERSGFNNAEALSQLNEPSSHKDFTHSLMTLTGPDSAYVQTRKAWRNMWHQSLETAVENKNWEKTSPIQHRGVIKFYTASGRRRVSKKHDLSWGFIQPLDGTNKLGGRDIHFNLFSLGNVPAHLVRKGLVVDYTITPGTNSATEINVVTFDQGRGSAMADSGAYVHVTPTKEAFISYKQLESPIPIGTAQAGSFVLLRGIGTIEICSGGSTKLIRNVFYAPDCGSTLLSVRMLTKMGGWILYSDEHISKLTHKHTGEEIILDDSFRFDYSYEKRSDRNPTKTTMSRDELAAIPGLSFSGGKERVEVINALNSYETDLEILHKAPLVAWYKNGLYQFQPLEPIDDTSMCKWHRRLGHLSINYVKKFAQIHGIVLTGSLGPHVCETCVLSKMTRQRSTDTRPRATSFLERVHADTIGPFTPVGFDQSVYALILVDGYSRSPYVYLQKTNTASETHDSFQKFCTQVQGKPRELQVDGGSEFKGICESWCAQENIRIRKSPPYAHYLNGTVERKIRSLKEMTRSMLTYSRLPQSFWPYALSTAQYIQQRSPSRALPGWKSPEQMITGSVSQHKHFKVFGSKVFFHNGAGKTDGSSSLSPRSHEGVFLGYGEGYPTGTYTILDTETFKVVHSNQVSFFETQNISHTKAWEHIDTEESPLAGFDVAFQDDDYEPDDEDVSDSEEPAKEAPNRSRRARQQVQRYDPEVEAARPQLQSHRSQRTMNLHSVIPGIQDDWQFEPEQVVAHLDCPETASKWQAAKEKELSQFSRFNAYTEVPRRSVPPGAQIIRTHFVRTIKSDGRYKYRLVAGGNEQLGSSAYSPTAALTSLRMVIAHATFKSWVIRQADVSAAYLQSDIQEVVYVERPPPDKDVDKRIYRQTVWRLNKAMYGLRKSPLCWYNTVTKAMAEHGLVPTPCDPCVFRKEGLIVGVWVDDFLYGGTSESIAAFETFLTTKFKCDVPSDASCFCGINITQAVVREPVQAAGGVGVAGQAHVVHRRKVALSQDRYVEKLLQDHNIPPAVVETPLQSYLAPCSPSESDETLPFREILGGVMYVMLATRPDLAFAVHHLSRFGQCFGQQHFAAVTRLLQYVHHTRHKRIIYQEQLSPKLLAYSDANWAGCPFTRKSTSGRIVFFGGSPVSWCSQLQHAISTSSCESELYSVTDAVKEVVYLRILLESMSATSLPTSTIYCDNHATVKLCNGEDNNMKKLRHIRKLQRFLDIRRKFIQSQVQEVRVVHCRADAMLADLLTKPLGPKKLSKNRDGILSAWTNTAVDA